MPNARIKELCVMANVVYEKMLSDGSVILKEWEVMELLKDYMRWNA